jgi:hypothetical protein
MRYTRRQAPGYEDTERLWRGLETPRRDKELIKQRLREAEQIAKDMKP